MDTVTVYVRKGLEDESRRLSFAIPKGFDSMAWLDDGWAVDGTHLVHDMAPPFSARRLLEAEQGLRASLKKLGFATEFK